MLSWQLCKCVCIHWGACRALRNVCLPFVLVCFLSKQPPKRVSLKGGTKFQKRIVSTATGPRGSQIQCPGSSLKMERGRGDPWKVVFFHVWGRVQGRPAPPGDALRSQVSVRIWIQGWDCIMSGYHWADLRRIGQPCGRYCSTMLPFWKESAPQTPPKKHAQTTHVAASIRKASRECRLQTWLAITLGNQEPERTAARNNIAGPITGFFTGPIIGAWRRP